MNNRVKVFKLQRVDKDGHGFLEKVEDGIGIFCAWGVDFEEFENGLGNFSTAIIKRSDGTVENIPVELVQFIDVE